MPLSRLQLQTWQNQENCIASLHEHYQGTLFGLWLVIVNILPKTHAEWCVCICKTTFYNLSLKIFCLQLGSPFFEVSPASIERFLRSVTQNTCLCEGRGCINNRKCGSFRIVPFTCHTLHHELFRCYDYSSNNYKKSSTTLLKSFLV
jgi:hypothetical protein